MISRRQNSRNHSLSWWVLFLSLLVVVESGVAADSHHDKASVAAVQAVGMTVSDLERAVAFYTTVLSFEKVSDVEVAGADYERLMGVFGLRMRVVRLQLGDAFLELTQYLAPRDGRPMPHDSRANDLWHWQTTLLTRDAEAAVGLMQAGKYAFVSPGLSTFPHDNLGYTKGVMVRDPDGHAMLLSQR